MKQSISKIHIHNLRGIRDINIDVDGKNLLLLGENGTGKSSVIDAIELFFTMSIEKIAGRGEIDLADAIPFAGSTDLARTIDVSFTGGKEPVNFVYLKTPVRLSAPEGYEDFFRLAAERPFILHRYQLTRFIEDRPADRYKRLSSLLGMEQLDRIVESWKAVVAQFLKDKNEAKQEEKLRLGELQTWVKVKISKDSDVCICINKALAPLGMPAISSRSEIVLRQNDLKNRFSRPINFARAEGLRTALARLGDVETGVFSVKSAYKSLFDAWTLFIQKSTAVADGPFEQIITNGRKAIAEYSLDKCPLCEQKFENRNSLIDRLDVRLQALHELVHARQDMEQEKAGLLRTITLIQNKVTGFQDSLAGIAYPLFAGISEFAKVLALLDRTLSLETLSLETPETVLKLVDDIFYSAADELKGYVNKELAGLEPTEFEQTVLDTNDFLARSDEKWADWQEKRLILEEREHKHSQVQTVCNALIEARKQGIQDVLDELQGEFIRLYNILHPGEGHKAITILMAENRNSSAELYAETDGIKAMHPLAHYSEGHLDSLGLCIFLALIKKFNSGLNLIIIDDVLTSIDTGHRMRVARLIASEFKDYQIILTTHDELWANELSTVFGNDKLALKTLRMNPWKQKSGATYSDYTATDWNYYFAEIAAGRTQDSIAGVGRKLEGFLYTMRKNLHIAIPATQDDRYTIGDLYDPFFTWLEKHPISRPDVQDFKQLFAIVKQELDDYWRFRNWSGAHYNEWGMAISQTEANTFVEIVRDIVMYFECPACSALVVYDPSKEVVHCPICKPNPSPKVCWYYKPEWKQNVARLKNTQDSRKKDENLVKMCESATEKFLQDARRKLRLPIAATVNDNYGLSEIYDAFIEFARKSPRYGEDNWVEKIDRVTLNMANFITPDRQWVDINNVLDKRDILLESAFEITSLFECSSCGDIVHFDPRNQTYFCAKCDKNEIYVAPGAHWFTE